MVMKFTINQIELSGTRLMSSFHSICRRVVGHIHWDGGGAAAFPFGLDSLCLFRRKPFFLVSISGRSGEAKNGFIFEIKFWLRVWSQLLSFLEFVASNSRLACLFFPSNARWLSPGRLSSRKDNCIVQIHRINAVATLDIMTM